MATDTLFTLDMGHHPFFIENIASYGESSFS